MPGLTRAWRALAAAAATTAAATGPALAGPTLRFDIPPGRLSDAVATLGRTAGVSVGIRSGESLPERTPGLHGRMSVRDALLRLAGGRGRVVQLDAATFLLLPARSPRPSPGAVREVRPAPDANPPDELVVTAGKRTTAYADFPGAVTLIDGRTIRPEAAKDGAAAIAARDPVLSGTNLGSGRNKLFLRGVADSSFNGASQATVGEYFGDMRVNYSAPDPDLRLYDVETIEVLEGPQGALYGAGSLGGLLRVTPTPPQLDVASGQAWGGASVTAEGRPGFDIGGVLDLPLAQDRAGVRLVAYGIHDGGYIDDLGRGVRDVNAVRVGGGRVAGRLRSGDWTIDILGAGQAIDSADSQYAETGAGPLARNGRVAEPSSQRFLLGSLVARRDFGDLHLTSTTGAVRQDLDETFDASQPDGAAMKLLQQSRVRLLSHETRLSRDRGGAWGWLAGVSVLDSVTRQARRLGPAAEPTPLGDVENRVLDLTAYGEATVRPVRPLALTAGLRVSGITLSGRAHSLLAEAGDPSVSGSRSEGRVLPALAAVWRPGHDWSVFARFEQGYRPGGLALAATVQQFNDDRLSTIEGGVRFASANGRVSLALTGAHADWSNVQADVLDGLGLPHVSNIGDAQIWSADLKAVWRPVDALTLSAAGFAARARLTTDAFGIIIVNSAPLPNVAPFGGRLGAEYTWSLRGGEEAAVWANLRYVGKSTLGVGPVLGLPQGDYLVTSLGARRQVGLVEVSVFVDNLLNSHANSFAFGTPYTIGLGDQVTPLRPRTIRIGLDRRF